MDALGQASKCCSMYDVEKQRTKVTWEVPIVEVNP